MNGDTATIEPKSGSKTNNSRRKSEAYADLMDDLENDIPK